MNLAGRSHDAFGGVAGPTHLYATGRTPCGGGGRNDGSGVFRLHKVIGFADDFFPLKMTSYL
jgi:hypothetical protein